MRFVQSVMVDQVFTYEGLPGVLGNKGTWPFTFREQGNKRKIKLGTRKQKHILGNTKIEEILLGNTGTQDTGKLCWEQGNIDSPGPLLWSDTRRGGIFFESKFMYGSIEYAWSPNQGWRRGKGDDRYTTVSGLI